MSIAQVLEELPAFTVAERQLLVRRAIEFDDSGPSPEDEEIIATRLEDHHLDPSSAVSLEDIQASIRTRLGK